MEFPYPTYPLYRTLRDVTPGLPAQRGSDVWALQVALNWSGQSPMLDTDGILGPKTGKAIWDYQHRAGIVEDGLAGGQTQQRLTMGIAVKACEDTGVPSDLLRGQLEHESSFRLGCYSSRRPDGSYDAGVTQRNTAHTPASEGFQPAVSIAALVARLKASYERFVGVDDFHRRWALAAGTWNAPAWAGWIANEEGASVPRDQRAEPTPAQRAILEGYMASCISHFAE